jgi:hypothetical protein
MMTMRGVALLCAFLLTVWGAMAGPLVPVSYDLLNGSGEAIGGGFNYWDLAYSGSGLTNVDGASLSGGTGDLTNGIIAVASWYLVENLEGTGPYVGWSDKITPNPAVTFRFAGPISLDAVTIYVDDANGYGAVSPPVSVDIGLEGGPSVNFLVTDPVGGDPVSYTFSGLGLTGSAVTLRFYHASEWVFVSEVTFDGAVPEPGTFWLGLACSAVLLRAAQRRA